MKITKKRIWKETYRTLSVCMAGMLVLSQPAAVFASEDEQVSENLIIAEEYDAQEAPQGTPGNPPGSGTGSTVTWKGATEITSETASSSESYTSENADENAVLINTESGVVVTLDAPSVSKTGGTSAGDSYSFYGINSAVMCKGGGTTNITGGTVATSAEGANGIFSYGANNGTTNAEGDGTTVNISGTVITTTGNGSGGIMTTYGGTTYASDLTVTTEGGSSAPIRTDRGGGWVTVNGGTYTSNGQGSPAIYSTADVDVTGAVLTSNKSEGVCIEGNGSIELTDCTLTASNTTKNGNAQYVDSVMIYQSMSGDANGTGSVFSMTKGTLNNKNGHVFHVTNTGATINLDGVDINNTDSDNILLSVVNDGWSGNTNTATLNASAQVLEGDIIVSSAASSASDSSSGLTLNLTDGSSFTGKIDDGNGGSTFSYVNVTIGEGCTWTLTGDSYVTGLTNNGTIDYGDYQIYIVDETPLSASSGSQGSGSQPGNMPTPPTGKQPGDMPAPPTGEQPGNMPTPPTGEQPGDMPTPPTGEQPGDMPTPPTGEAPAEDTGREGGSQDGTGTKNLTVSLVKGQKASAADILGTASVNGIRYESDDKNVVSVTKKGILKGGNKAGTANVTAYTVTKENKTATKNVIGTMIVTNEIPKLTAMKSAKAGEQIDAAQYLTGVSEAGVTSWKSSKSSVASIDEEGIITVNKNGTTRITAVFGTGTQAVRYSALLKVSTPKLSKNSIKIREGKKTTLVLKNTKLTPEWSIEDESIASLTVSGTSGRKAVITGNCPGTTTACATVDGVTYECEITVK
ncbi:MAG: hypothetical protein IJS86_08195 [Lachnospiraceae bacterium]|nr:hypothetical protein [Lachnospiraceae bacterium]